MGSGPKCAGCPLYLHGTGFTRVEVGKNYDRTRLLLVGEASGEAEARESLPFRPYAQSGSLLADAFRAVMIDRSEVAITNVCRCRPPRDYWEGSPWQYHATVQCTTNYLGPAIEELKPRAILALGGTALRALTPTIKGKYGTLDYIRGYVQRGSGPAGDIPVIATYHPAFLRRGAPELTPLLRRDLRRAYLVGTGRLERGSGYVFDPAEAGVAYQTAPMIDEAWEWVERVDPELPLAYDIETPMSRRNDEDERTSFTDRDIKLFQCTQHRGRGIALPFRDEYVDTIRAILGKASLRVGFNNWNFDDPVLGANRIDVGMTDDAMVMFGTYWSDLPKNLQAAAQMAGFPFPWKHFGETDLEFYGCADVDATLAVYEYMVKTLSGEEVAA